MNEIRLIEDNCYLRVRLVVLKCLGIILLVDYIDYILRWIANSNWSINFTHLYYELCENFTFSWTIPTTLGLIQLFLLIHIFRKINYTNYTIKECRFLRAWMVIPFIFVISRILGFWIARFTSDVTFMGYNTVTIYLYYLLVLYASLIFCIFFRSKVTYMYTAIFLVIIFGFYLVFPYINCIFDVLDSSYNPMRFREQIKLYDEFIEFFYGSFNQYNTFFVANAVLLIDEKLLIKTYRKIRSGFVFMKQKIFSE